MNQITPFKVASRSKGHGCSEETHYGMCGGSLLSKYITVGEILYELSVGKFYVKNKQIKRNRA